jgi:hypothetical protein
MPWDRSSGLAIRLPCYRRGGGWVQHRLPDAAGPQTPLHTSGDEGLAPELTCSSMPGSTSALTLYLTVGLPRMLPPSRRAFSETGLCSRAPVAGMLCPPKPPVERSGPVPSMLGAIASQALIPLIPMRGHLRPKNTSLTLAHTLPSQRPSAS